MILTPLQIFGGIALIVLLCAIVMTLVHLYLPLRTKTVAELQDQMSTLKHNWAYYSDSLEAYQARIENLEDRDITINQPVTSQDDPMALWDAIVNHARREEHLP